MGASVDDVAVGALAACLVVVVLVGGVVPCRKTMAVRATITTIMPARANRGFEVQFQEAGWLSGGRAAGCDKSGIDSKTVAARDPEPAGEGEAWCGDSMGLVKDPSLDADGRNLPTFGQQATPGRCTWSVGAFGQEHRRRRVIGSVRIVLEP